MKLLDAGEELRMLQTAHSDWAKKGLRLIAVNVDDSADESVRAFTKQFTYPILRGSEDAGAIYNILYRQIFDRHRDMSLPTSFLIDGKGDIVKVYQGAD